LPVETLSAYRDHGHPKLSLDQNVSTAYRVLNHLSFVGINLNAATQRLEEEGVKKFVAAFDRLMVSLQEKQAVVRYVPHLLHV